MRTLQRCLSVLLLASACHQGPELGHLGANDRLDKVGSFEDFKAQLYCRSEMCIVEGDIPVYGDDDLRARYAQLTTSGQALSAHQVAGQLDTWRDRQQLNYCVSDDFGDRREQIRLVTAGAADDWGIDFFREWPGNSADCERDFERGLVDFVVRPEWGMDGPLAYAFFPSMARERHEVVVFLDRIDDAMARYGDMSFRGLMRHELGHVLGFRHEHERRDAREAICDQYDDLWSPTPYDSSSVMHYPQCGGTNDWQLELSESDRVAARFFYPLLEPQLHSDNRCFDTESGYNQLCPLASDAIHFLLSTGEPSLLANWVGLSPELVADVEARAVPRFEHVTDAFEGLGEEDLASLYDYIFAGGRCPVEWSNEANLLDSSCVPVMVEVLDFVNWELTPADATSLFGVPATKAQRFGLVHFSHLRQLYELDGSGQLLRRIYQHLYPELPSSVR